MTIDNYMTLREQGVPSRQFNFNNGVVMSTDDFGRPFQFAEATPEAIRALREAGAIRNPNLYVQHSNDGGEFLAEMIEKAN